MAMLSFDIRSLEPSAPWPSTSTLAADDPVWEHGDPKPSIAAPRDRPALGGRAGRFYWHGTIEGDVALACRRCLGDASAHVSEDAHLLFAEAGTEGDRTIPMSS